MTRVCAAAALAAAVGLASGPGLQARPGVVAERDQPEQRLTIVAFGDSLTSGHRLPRDQAYPAVLAALLADAGLPSDVINMGVSGDTTAGGVRRLEAALAHEPQILIVAFGANDGLRGVSVAAVRENLERIVGTARDRGIEVLLCGMEALPIHGWQYTIDFHGIMPGIAARYNVPLVPFLLTGVFGDPELMTADQIHPNAAGARVMAANVFAHLRPLAERVFGPAAAAAR